jgi:hypothetical protein
MQLDNSYHNSKGANMKKRDVMTLINSKRFVQSVAIRSINTIDYLVIGDHAQAVSSWQKAWDSVNSLEVVKEFKGNELTDEQLAGVQPLPKSGQTGIQG